MKLIHVLTLATTALAVPQGWSNWNGAGYSNCLTDDQANNIVELNRVFQLKADVAAAKSAGETLFAADDYVEYGDSINSLRGAPLGTLVEPNGTTYVANVLSAPGLGGINTLAVVHNCDTIVWHFQFLGVGGPNSTQRVNGFSKIAVDLSRSVQPVVRQDVEFNSLAWAADSGFTIIPPTTGEYAPGPGGS